MTGKHLEPIHPGEILEEEFMRPLGFSANSLARAIDVPVTRISDIVRARRGITADTALRLSRFFQTSPDLWLGLQSEYDLRIARREYGESIERHVTPLQLAGGRYESGAARKAGGGSVREPSAAYSPAGQIRTRDRRRARRPRST